MQWLGAILALFNWQKNSEESNVPKLDYATLNLYLSIFMWNLNTLASGWFWEFSQKKQQFSVALPTP